MGRAALAFHAAGPCFGLSSIGGTAAFQASWRAVSARIFAPMIRPRPIWPRAFWCSWLKITGSPELLSNPRYLARPRVCTALTWSSPLRSGKLGWVINDRAVLRLRNLSSALRRYGTRFLGVLHMDVYLNAKRDLLVVRSGKPTPTVATLGSWRKIKTKRDAKVSEEIRSALETQGYYMRKLKDVYRRD